MNHFITLPSGSRLNARYISHYRAEKDGKGIVIYTVDDEVFPEDMTTEQLDALLSPPSSPIVEAVVNLDNLKPGKACCFTYYGQVKHGVIKDFEVDHVNKIPCSSIHMTSAGMDYYLHLNNETVYLGD